MGEGSTVATSVKGEIDSQYTLHNNGTTSDMACNIIDNIKDITHFSPQSFKYCVASFLADVYLNGISYCLIFKYNIATKK